MKKLFMNEKGLAPVIIAAVVVGVLAAGGGGWYLFVRDDGGNESTTTSESTATTEAPAEQTDGNFEGSYFEAMSRGEAIQCSWKLPEGTAEGVDNIEGKFYTDGNNRGYSTGTFKQGNATITTNMVIDSENVYSWTQLPGVPAQGFKASRATFESPEGGSSELTDEQKKQGEQFLSKYSFECQPWTVDESMLAPPSDITFRELPI